MQYATLCPDDDDDDEDGDEDVDSTRRPSVSLVAVQAVRLHRSAGKHGEKKGNEMAISVIVR